MLSILNPLINEIAQRVANSRGIHAASLLRRTVYAIVVAALVAILSSASIVETPLEAFIIYLALPLTIVGHSWVIGALSGLHRMTVQGATLVASASARIVILVPFLIYAPSLLGIAWSYVACFTLTTLLAWPLLGKHLKLSDQTPWTTNWGLITGFFLLALPFSLDQTLIQALHPALSGDYGALMTYAKSVMLVAAPALTIAYSSAVQHNSTKKGTRAHLIMATTVATLAFTLALALWLVHPYLFPLLLGPKYPTVMPHLGVALAAVALHVISYYLTQLLLLTSRFWLCMLLALPIILEVYFLTASEINSVADCAWIALYVFTLQFVLTCFASLLHVKAFYAQKQGT